MPRVIRCALLCAAMAACSALSLQNARGESLRDCADVCPEMVVVPGSPPGFAIGSPPDEPARQSDEGPHKVTVPSFAIGRYEVTVAEYRACVEAGGCKPPEWLEPGGQHNVETGSSAFYKRLGEAVTGARYPIVGIGWSDADAYVRWLAAKTGKGYRLPSEAEWEYAARAGAATRFWWGDDVQPNGRIAANCRGCGSEWDAKSSAPADSFPPNPWGLHNVHGNVWEWVADIYCADYASGPADGRARETDDCPVEGPRGLRVLRGGSCCYEPQFIRAAIRLRNRPDFRNSSVGFRAARGVP